MAKATFHIHENDYVGLSGALDNGDLERTFSRAKTAAFVDHVNGSALKLVGTASFTTTKATAYSLGRSKRSL